MTCRGLAGPCATSQVSEADGGSSSPGRHPGTGRGDPGGHAASCCIREEVAGPVQGAKRCGDRATLSRSEKGPRVLTISSQKEKETRLVPGEPEPQRPPVPGAGGAGGSAGRLPPAGPAPCSGSPPPRLPACFPGYDIVARRPPLTAGSAGSAGAASRLPSPHGAARVRRIRPFSCFSCSKTGSGILPPPGEP